jgi:HSP20 family molecular chaperone IbpA
MHTIIPTIRPETTDREAATASRQPHFECRDLPQALKLVVLVPGVDATGVEITTRGPDLFLTARKAKFVRVNWQALHLEGVQHDYELALRLGLGLDFDDLHASLQDGVLTITVPKRALHTQRERRVA